MSNKKIIYSAVVILFLCYSACAPETKDEGVYGWEVELPDFDLIVVKNNWKTILSVAPIAVKENVPLLVGSGSNPSINYFIEDYVVSTGKKKVLSLDGAYTSHPSPAEFSADMPSENFIVSYWKKKPPAGGYGIYTTKSVPDEGALANALYAAVKGVPFVVEKDILNEMGVADQRDEPKTKDEVNNEVISGGGYTAPTLTVTNPGDGLAPLAVLYAAYRKTPIAFISSSDCDVAAGEVISQAKKLNSFFDLHSAHLADQYMVFIVSESGLKHLMGSYVSPHGFEYHGNCDVSIANFGNKDYGIPGQDYHDRIHYLFGPGRIGFKMDVPQSSALIVRGVFYDKIDKKGNVLLTSSYINGLQFDFEFYDTINLDNDIKEFKGKSDIIVALGVDDISAFLGDVDVVYYHAHCRATPEACDFRTHSAIIVGSSCGSSDQIGNYINGMSALLGSTTTISTLQWDPDKFVEGTPIGRVIKRTTDALASNKGLIIYGDPLIKYRGTGSTTEPKVYAVGVTDIVPLAGEEPRVETLDTFFLPSVFTPNFKEKRIDSWFKAFKYISGVPIKSIKVKSYEDSGVVLCSSKDTFTETSCEFKLARGLPLYRSLIDLVAISEYKGSYVEIPVYPCYDRGYTMPDDPNGLLELNRDNIKCEDGGSKITLTLRNRGAIDVTDASAEITSKYYGSCGAGLSESKRIEGFTVAPFTSKTLVFDGLCKSAAFELEVRMEVTSDGVTAEYSEYFCINCLTSDFVRGKCKGLLIIKSPVEGETIHEAPILVDAEFITDENSVWTYQARLFSDATWKRYDDLVEVTTTKTPHFSIVNYEGAWDHDARIWAYVTEATEIISESVASNTVNIHVEKPSNLPEVEILFPKAGDIITSSPVTVKVKAIKTGEAPYYFRAWLRCGSFESGRTYDSEMVVSPSDTEDILIDFDEAYCKAASEVTIGVSFENDIGLQAQNEYTTGFSIN